MPHALRGPDPAAGPAHETRSPPPPSPPPITLSSASLLGSPSLACALVSRRDGRLWVSQSSPALMALLGGGEEVAHGFALEDRVAADERPLVLPLPHEDPRVVEFRSRPGQPVWLRLRTLALDAVQPHAPPAAAPAPDAGPPDPCWLVLAEEATATQRQAARLAHLQQVLGAAMDGVSSNVCVLDGEGVIVAVNRAWREFALANGGTERATCEGVNYLRVCEHSARHAPHVHPADGTPSFAQALREVIEGRLEHAQSDYPCPGPQGQRWYTATARAVSTAVQRFVVVEHHPVVFRKLAEARLMEAQKLEALGALAGGIAHDFNHTLAAMLGSAKLARDVLPDSHAAVGALDVIRDAGRRARGLVEQILLFSRREELKPQRLDLASHLRGTLRLLRAAVPAEARLVDELGTQPVVVVVDPVQLDQIVFNLVSNAVQALQGRAGQVTLSLRAGLVRREQAAGLLLSAPRPYAQLSVRDTGMGIEPQDLARIFEPLFTTKPVGQGTGLGLTSAKTSVTRAGGSIGVESQPGQGSTFTVYLPLAPAAAADTDPAPQAPTPQPKAAAATDPHNPASAGLPGLPARVLLVDDDEVVGTVSQAILAREGIQVTLCHDPADALERLRHQAFDAVVTDLHMPGMSGVELSAAVRAAGHRMPLVLMSGFLAGPEIDRAHVSGVDRLVRKELVHEELIAVLREALREPGPATDPQT